MEKREEVVQQFEGRRGNREERDFEKEQLKELEILQQKKKEKAERLKADRLAAKQKPDNFGKVPKYLGQRKQELKRAGRKTPKSSFFW